MEKAPTLAGLSGSRDHHPEAEFDSKSRAVPRQMASGCILGMRVDATSYADATNRVFDWVDACTPAYVCVATVHMVMEAFDAPEYQKKVNGAALVTPDGVPLVWSLRGLGNRGASRVYGPDLTKYLIRQAARRGVSVGFYGGTEAAVSRMREVLQHRYPTLEIAYAFAPPFRALSAEEDEQVVADIRRSGVQILFVGLGCPKQERWMADHAGRIPAVMLGVGAAFDFLTHTKPQAPRWMMSAGLEWVFRLSTEPRRLWKRYLKQNPRFVFYFFRQRLGLWKDHVHNSGCGHLRSALPEEHGSHRP